MLHHEKAVICKQITAFSSKSVLADGRYPPSVVEIAYGVDIPLRGKKDGFHIDASAVSDIDKGTCL